MIRILSKKLYINLSCSSKSITEKLRSVSPKLINRISSKKSMENEGWLQEATGLWSGQKFCLEINSLLFDEISDFQHVKVYDSKTYGKVLTLDGIIQCTERDEFSYQEMITHLPLCALNREPKNVLVIGGGDGGVLRELSRYDSLETIELAEIDRKVIEVVKQYFPTMAVGFEDPRVSVNVCDGFDFVKKANKVYDAIIVDSSDPIGPAEVLYKKPFFEAIYEALKPGGILCTQGECMWLHLPLINNIAKMCQDVFQDGSVSYAYTTIPTYPSGQIGFMICMKGDVEDCVDLDPRIPRRSVKQHSTLPPLKYYDSEIHSAAFVLPPFVKKQISSNLTFQ